MKDNRAVKIGWATKTSLTSSWKAVAESKAKAKAMASRLAESTVPVPASASSSSEITLQSRSPADIIEPSPAALPASFPAPNINTEPSQLPKPKIPPRGRYLRHQTRIPPARYGNMVLHQAQVKSVLSGDTLILSSITQPDSERTLSLAYCTAPHLKKEGDEIGAYESRDALRELIVGKTVQFAILYTIPNTKREYGIVYLNDGRKLPEAMIKLGWLKLREDAGRKEDSEEAHQHLKQLKDLEKVAHAEHLGLWNPEISSIEVQHDMGNAKAWMEKYKGQTLDGLVERVLSGDRLLVRVILSPTEHVNSKSIPCCPILEIC